MQFTTALCTALRACPYGPCLIDSSFGTVSCCSEITAALHLMLCKHQGPYTLSGQVILTPLPAVHSGHRRDAGVSSIAAADVDTVLSMLKSTGIFLQELVGALLLWSSSITEQYYPRLKPFEKKCTYEVHCSAFNR